MPPPLLVALFHATALEQQVVIVCDDDELRLAVCEILLMLLHPLEWVHVYVPTIPECVPAPRPTPNPAAHVHVATIS